EFRGELSLLIGQDAGEDARFGLVRLNGRRAHGVDLMSLEGSLGRPNPILIDRTPESSKCAWSALPTRPVDEAGDAGQDLRERLSARSPGTRRGPRPRAG